MTWNTATQAAAAAFSGTFGEAVTVGSTTGTGILTPDPGGVVGGRIEIQNGARLAVLATDFPSLAVNDSVTRGSDSFVIVDIDRAIDAAGFRHCTVARA